MITRHPRENFFSKHKPAFRFVGELVLTKENQKKKIKRLQAELREANKILAKLRFDIQVLRAGYDKLDRGPFLRYIGVLEYWLRTHGEECVCGHCVATKAMIRDCSIDPSTLK
jgi:hypothetical protein